MSRSTREMLVRLILVAAGGLLLWWWLRQRLTAGRPADALQGTARGDADDGPFVSDEVEALARVVASECGSQPRDTQNRIAWVARDRARQRATSIAQMVCQPCGRQVGNARPFSSRQRPLERHREVARLVLAAAPSSDPTNGATSILEPSAMDRQFAAGRARFDARGVRQRWLRGLDFYGSAGGWDFFGPRGGPGAQPVPPEWSGGAAPTVSS